MAHGIMENDGMFSGSGIRPWHGLGTIIDGTATSEEAIRLANLGWDVVQEPVYLKDGTELDNIFANIRSDTHQMLGVVKDKYTIAQNRDCFTFLDNIIQNSKGVEARYETAGSLFNGKKVFALVRLPDSDLVGDKVENYLFLSNAHDGSQGLCAGITNIRVVCNNTLQMAEHGAQRIWKIRHCSSLEAKQKEAENSLGLALNYQERLAQDAERLALEKVNEEKFFKEFFKKLDASEKQKEKIVTSIRDLYIEKDDLQNFRGTKWGMYNAIADYISNNKDHRKTETYDQWNMQQFMTGYPLLQTAQKIIMAA